MAEVGGDVLQFDFLADRHNLGLRVDLSGIGEDGSLEASLDDAIILDIKVGEESDKRERKNCECA